MHHVGRRRLERGSSRVDRKDEASAAAKTEYDVLSSEGERPRRIATDIGKIITGQNHFGKLPRADVRRHGKLALMRGVDAVSQANAISRHADRVPGMIDCDIVIEVIDDSPLCIRTRLQADLTFVAARTGNRQGYPVFIGEEGWAYERPALTGGMFNTVKAPKCLRYAVPVSALKMAEALSDRFLIAPAEEFPHDSNDDVQFRSLPG